MVRPQQRRRDNEGGLARPTRSLLPAPHALGLVFYIAIFAILVVAAHAAPVKRAAKPLTPGWNIPTAYRHLFDTLLNQTQSQSGNRSSTHSPLKPNIIGGVKVPRGELPWVAMIQYNGGEFCTGVMIGRKLMLTAGHCTHYDDDNTNFHVIANYWDITIDPAEQNAVEFSVVKQMSHPLFDGSTFAHDLGIWELKPLDPTMKVTPARLNLDFPAIPSPNYATVTVAGWGVLSVDSGDGSDQLYKVNLPTVPIPICAAAMQKKDPSTPIFPQSAICAGPKAGMKDSCRGDSGGPLYSFVNGQPMVHALTSWGVGCAEPNAYGVYQRVSDGDRGAWIKKILASYPAAERGNVDVGARTTTKKVIRTTTKKVIKTTTKKPIVKTTPKAAVKTSAKAVAKTTAKAAAPKTTAKA